MAVYAGRFGNRFRSHACCYRVYFLLISSIVQLLSFRLTLIFLSIFFIIFFFLDGGREEGGLSKDSCNDGALFIIHENEGYVVFFHSIFEKIVPVQAIRIYISIISFFFSFNEDLLSHFTNNRNHRK